MGYNLMRGRISDYIGHTAAIFRPDYVWYRKRGMMLHVATFDIAKAMFEMSDSDMMKPVLGADVIPDHNEITSEDLALAMKELTWSNMNSSSKPWLFMRKSPDGDPYSSLFFVEPALRDLMTENPPKVAERTRNLAAIKCCEKLMELAAKSSVAEAFTRLKVAGNEYNMLCVVNEYRRAVREQEVERLSLFDGMDDVAEIYARRLLRYPIFKHK